MGYRGVGGRINMLECEGRCVQNVDFLKSGFNQKEKAKDDVNINERPSTLLTKADLYQF